MRDVMPGFTLVEYLFIIGAVLVLPSRFVVVLIAAVVLYQLARLSLALVYRKWFAPFAGDTHESDC